MQSTPWFVNDVSGLNPVPVLAISKPISVDEVVQTMRSSRGAVSIGGGHFSMGGQTASPGSLHLDLRGLNQVIAFSPQDKSIRVQAGIRWCDIQSFIDPHGLSVKIMQTYANFTVGGSLSVNVHGRYMGLGPVILSVRNIRLVMADGRIEDASPTHNAELFYAAIGGYGGLGVIVEAELELADNVRVRRVHRKLAATDYLAHFRQKVRPSADAIFHNADLYPPDYRRVRSVTWMRTDAAVTEPRRLHAGGRSYALERYFIWAITETPLGKWRREYLIDPLMYLRKKVHWRNFEASYDAAELEPVSRRHSTYVLQEYFIPVERFDEFVPQMAEILQRHRVNVLNISVRHAQADSGSLMAWARGETFAFVMYYKQRTRDNAINRVGVWTRELIDAVLRCGGTYYLPYQPHATHAQFHAAYPRAKELFALKQTLDPDYRLRNGLWDKYYAQSEPAAPAPDGEFRVVFGDTVWQDRFYRFLQNIYRIYPEDRYHTLIKRLALELGSDEEVYRRLQREQRAIRPLLADLRLALPALARQKKEMTCQSLALLADREQLDGYIEIGSPGRYLSELSKHLPIASPITLVHEGAPGNSPVDIAERGGLGKIGRFVPLDDYAPLPSSLGDASVDLVACYIGLHHCPPQRLDAFVRSIVRVLRPGGRFILREHDVRDEAMRTFVSLVHTVFNAGLNESWETDRQELRHFRPVAEWVDYLQARGLRDSGLQLLQEHDPTDNVLLAFIKEAA